MQNRDHIYEESKNSDQSVKADAGKPKLTLVPRQIIYDIAEVREYGNNKYPEGGPDNWKKVDKQRYRDALFRHFLLYLDDPQGTDEESGIKHLKHIACNVAFLCELEACPEEDYITLYSANKEYFKFEAMNFEPVDVRVGSHIRTDDPLEPGYITFKRKEDATEINPED